MDKATMIGVALTMIGIMLPAVVSLCIMLHKLLNALTNIEKLIEKTTSQMIAIEERHYDKLEARIQRLEDGIHARYGREDRHMA